MLTSFAPSPIAKHTALCPLLTNSTTNAFCNGLVRQQITDLHTSETSKIFSRASGDSKRCLSAPPSMTSAFWMGVPFSVTNRVGSSEDRCLRNSEAVLRCCLSAGDSWLVVGTSSSDRSPLSAGRVS
ncbi:hypothetical protein BC936DRAFT_148375 [Jimgerdemannia flammicorona]|uniref:Uncharacterized protein n=2 Tax=Jimgerdemannia flammicorona TaxID=994334 RepID=A0A433QEF3_9FUNG|nr:hypothetical protein BC936DRAFT_148375 [Jimgerdemannia flammicorona]RUS28152.1 hypothetical protein BC938DRAFT_482253 [Jimgerdemannia flammicorona]